MNHPIKIKDRLSEIDDEFQLIIIGGGIYGAAVCWEAAHRGIKTLLVEQEDYSSGASSNSLKTIHGGLRSLQSLNLPAVIKGIRERTIFQKIASNYVKPLACVLPTTHDLKRSRLFIGSGLLVYNILSRVINGFLSTNRTFPQAGLLSKKEFLNRLKGLTIPEITGGGLWYDAQVEDTERMVLQFIKSAVKHDAVALNHTAAIQICQTTKKNQHCLLIEDQINGHSKHVNAPAIIDCSASWNFASQSFDKENINNSVTFLKSVNIVINRKLSDTAFGINIKEKNSSSTRLYFFAPWRDCTIIGTWYSYEENYPNKNFSRQDAMRCLDDVNTVITDQQLDLADICNVHIGFLPAHLQKDTEYANIDKDLLSQYQLSDWATEFGVPHIYSLRGTKYTLARHDAKQVIDQLSDNIGWNALRSQSDKLAIFQECNQIKDSAGLTDQIIQHLKSNYGSDIHVILGIISKEPELAELIPGAEYHIKAEIHFAVLAEQALTLSDLLRRRLDIGSRSPPGLETSSYCARSMQKILSWSNDKRQLELDDLYASYPDFLHQYQRHAESSLSRSADG